RRAGRHRRARGPREAGYRGGRPRPERRGDAGSRRLRAVPGDPPATPRAARRADDGVPFRQGSRHQAQEARRARRRRLQEADQPAEVAGAHQAPRAAPRQRLRLRFRVRLRWGGHPERATVGRGVAIRITRVYPRRGDHGETDLVGGERTSKEGPRIEAYGTVDELNAAIGARSEERRVGKESRSRGGP